MSTDEFRSLKGMQAFTASPVVPTLRLIYGALEALMLLQWKCADRERRAFSDGIGDRYPTYLKHPAEPYDFVVYQRYSTGSDEDALIV